VSQPQESQHLRSDVVPQPDPTRLTTLAVDRALGNFRELWDREVAAINKATELVAKDSERIAAAQERNRELLRQDVQRQLDALRELLETKIASTRDVRDERFKAISVQFAERDVRAEQTDKERRLSLDAALAAAKEAVAEQQKANGLAIGKSEETTKERLDSLERLMETNITALRESYADLKSRLDRGGGHEEAQKESKVDSRANIGLYLLAASVIIAAMVAVVGFA
jgi:hypothetical protein